ncbi:LLM class flavin-dependent oxidoreductase [Streptomyces roseoverticillatus]|uniref:LLM class flavin-dependent oxidoreductase n=1 Tax=Streptomyces roseoverticillatus TaxID=66429 RepID=UPI001F1C3D2F|nr:LLM class flavin-dependent oxidoreductase [Streptomyces roseoverticillatus]MCF3105995.1 LLM class flavin-dependent oxidoreductase [Streptomyces roseoverticillatus]
MNIPFSILDLAPVVTGSSSTQALRNTIDLARHADRLGYTRYWLAEHHGMPGVASSAPSVLIAEIAAVTSRMRIGAGGVMLPNHAPLIVAEQFGMLEALHPGRIDLGVGRNAGIDPRVGKALRLSTENQSVEDFTKKVIELQNYFDEGSLAVPAAGNRPPMWLLGSSIRSAKMAALFGLRFAFAHHLNDKQTVPALDAYREAFRPSAELEKPYSLITVPIICAETDTRARKLAEPGALAFVELQKLGVGQSPRAQLPTMEEAENYPYSNTERETVETYFESQIIGGQETVRTKLDNLIQCTRADEIMATGMVYRNKDLLRSYELLAGLYSDGECVWTRAPKNADIDA